MTTARKAPAAKTKPNPRAPGLGDAEVEDVGGDPQKADPLDELNSLMAELAGSVSSNVTVYRTGRGVQRAYVFKCDAASFSLDVLRDKYNGGEFQLFITRDGVLWKNRTVTIEPPQAVRDPAPPPTAPAMDAVTLLREDLRKQNEMIAGVLRTLAAPAPPPRSIFEGVNMMELVQSAGVLLNMLRPPPAPQQTPPVETYINALMKGVELAKEVKSEGGESDTGLMGVVKEMLRSPLLATAMQAAASQATAPQPQPRPQLPVRPRPPAPPVAAAAPPVTPPAAPPAESFAGETSDMMPMLKMYLGLLVGKAAAQSDPGIYADLVLDNLSDEQLNQLLDAQPSPVDWLATIDPAVLTHREWFESLIAQVEGALTVDDEQEGVAPLAPPLPTTGQPDASGSTAPPVSGESAPG